MYALVLIALFLEHHRTIVLKGVFSKHFFEIFQTIKLVQQLIYL